MSRLFAVLLNGVAQLEYDRTRVLPDDQKEFLDRIDARLDQGFIFGDTRVDAPDLGQKAQYVALQLVQYIKAGDEPHAAAFCAWLAYRLPDLKQLKVVDQDGRLNLDLVFDEEYTGQVGVQITMPGLNS